jgi:hypothetical protein
VAYALALIGGALAVAPRQARAQEPANAVAPAESKFSMDQLDQMAAPIALYPDSLLAQIFMASTYPLEIVRADRWRTSNAKLAGAELEAALKDQTWDASVKSLCTFPTVLQRMSVNLDWTQDVGDAFLGQREELMQSVQRLRKKAHDSGNLETTQQQTVVVEKEVIVIQPASPQVIYVPTYSPSVIYVPTYPVYPVMYAPPPPGAAFFTFAAGVAVGAAIWGDCNWHGGDVNVNVNHYNNYNRNTNVNYNQNTNIQGNRNVNASGQTSWNHDASHRQGVNYKNPQTAQQYGGAKGAGSASANQARGRSSSAAASGGGARPSTGSTAPGAGGQTGAGARPSTGSTAPRAGGQSGGGARPSTGSTAAGAGGQAGGGSRPSTGSTAPRAGGQSGGGAFGGSQNSSFDRAASNRGSQSRGSGGSRGGGGGSGGRRGR